MERKLKVLFFPYQHGGHSHSMIGLAKRLSACGHQVIFLTEKFNERLYQDNNLESWTYETEDNPAHDAKTTYEILEFWHKWPSLFKFVPFIFGVFKTLPHKCRIIIQEDINLKNVIFEFDPDVIILDQLINYPAIIVSGKPFVWFHSFNPYFWFGKSNQNGKFVLSRELRNAIYRMFSKAFIAWRGYKFNGENYPARSPFLDIYIYPKELDYPDYFYKNVDNLFQLDASFNKDQIQNLSIEENLSRLIEYKSDKKLILVSFGLLQSYDVKFMKMIIRILSRSEHKFIVSKGMNHESFKIARNMCGAKSVNQRGILPMIDLFINHGGNNSFTEAFYFGKPQIIIPFWADQYDNAKRIDELNFGITLNCLKLNERTLLGAIDKLLHDQQLNDELQKISIRIQSENRLDQARLRIEKLAEENIAK